MPGPVPSMFATSVALVMNGLPPTRKTPFAVAVFMYGRAGTTPVARNSQTSPGSSMLLWLRSPSLNAGSIVFTDAGRNAIEPATPPSSVTDVRSIETAPAPVLVFATRYVHVTVEPAGSTTPGAKSASSYAVGFQGSAALTAF